MTHVEALGSDFNDRTMEISNSNVTLAIMAPNRFRRTIKTGKDL